MEKTKNPPVVSLQSAIHAIDSLTFFLIHADLPEAVVDELTPSVDKLLEELFRTFKYKRMPQLD